MYFARRLVRRRPDAIKVLRVYRYSKRIIHRRHHPVNRSLNLRL